MGVVYAAWDRDTESLCALKTLPHLAAEQLYRLKKEFRAVSDVDHSGLVQLGELFQDGDTCFFTMELLDAVDFQSYVRTDNPRGAASQPPDSHAASAPTMRMPGLHQAPRATASSAPTMRVTERHASRRNAGGAAAAARLPSRPDSLSLAPADTVPSVGSGHFDEERVRAGLEQLAAAVVALHDKGIVHRDLKPSNVLIESSGRLVVLDFGIAGSVYGADFDDGGEALGTPAFMAPEQTLTSARITPACDWYAVGCILFHALTGRFPFEGPAGQVMASKREQSAPGVGSLIENCPPDLDELCSALLARAPGERPNGPQVLARLRARTHSDRPATASATNDIFVGRERELQRLLDALDAAATGQAASLLVEGEPGVGKSELVEQFLARAAAVEPVTVLRGRCYERENIPFKGLDALIDALSGHLKRQPNEATRAMLPPGAHLVAALFPVLYRVPAIAERAPPLDRRDLTPTQRSAAFDALGDLLEAVGRQARLVLFLDDLQWAGDDSFELLNTLARRSPPLPALLLGTRRTTDAWTREAAAAESSKAEAVRPFPLGEAFARLPVSGLSTTESARLLDELQPVARTQAHLEALLREAGGHPLFLRELARACADDPTVVTTAPLDEILRSRIGRLPFAARALLEVVALAGVPLPAPVVARVAGVARAESVAMLRRLRREQLIRTDGASSRTIAPYHDRVREAIAEGLTQGTYAAALDLDGTAIHLALARELTRARAEDSQPVSAATLVKFHSQLLLSSNFDEATVLRFLGVLALSVDADRAYLFEYDAVEKADQVSASQRFEWSGESCDPQIDNPELQGLPMSELFPRWVNAFAKGDSIWGPVSEFPEAERGILEPQDIQSILVCPVGDSDEVWGFVGFDDCRGVRQWDRYERQLLATASSAFAAALGHRNAKDRLDLARTALQATLRTIGR